MQEALQFHVKLWSCPASLAPEVSKMLLLFTRLGNISVLLFFPRTDSAEAASFPHSIPPLGLMILLLWPSATRESTKICSLNGWHFSQLFQQVFLSLPTESVFKLSHKRKRQIPIPSNIACKVVPAHSPEVLLDIRLECGFDLQTPSSMFNQNISVYAKQQPLAPLGFFSQHLPRKDRTLASLLSIVPWNSPVQEPNLTEDQ